MPKFKCYVGVPVFNEEKYIEQTLLSLIRQDEDNVCFHVSDNCSTDNTWNIINDICARDKRFLITHD
ncbi:glycosyltransferase [Aeromonas veronii]|uniref:glycosyltransferase family 2 protein n=1 Tax=Aeromonas veronii TaxID=654 RepID=UPI0009B62EDA